MILFTVTGQAILANRACENFKNVTRVVNLQFSGEARPAERHCERPHRRKVGIHPQVEIFRLPHIVVGGERHGADHHGVKAMPLEDADDIFRST